MMSFEWWEMSYKIVFLIAYTYTSLLFLYLNLKKSITPDKIKVIEFAAITGTACDLIPYNNHIPTPVVNNKNIANETSFADLVL